MDQVKSNKYAISSSATVAVIGAGTMGRGIALVAAQAGHPVVLFDAETGLAAASIAQITATLERRISRGKLTDDEAAEIISNISPCDRRDGLSVLRGAALIIEAIVEDFELKQQLFEELDTIIDDEVILASNTSSLSITALAKDIKNPQRIAGFHFFNPAPAMKLVEVVRGLQTDQATCDCLVATAEAWGKAAVVVSSTPGFIVNRVARSFYAEPLRALELGVASVADMDALFTGAGFRIGPFALMDTIGLDVNYAVTQSVYEAFYRDARFRPSLVQRQMVDAGRLGRKTGYGFYRYDCDGHSDAASGGEQSVPISTASSVQSSPIVVTDHCGVLEPLCGRLAEHFTLHADRSESALYSGCISVDDTDIVLTDGRPALELALRSQRATAVFDLVSNFETATCIGIAASDDSALAVAASLFQAAGIKAIKLKDHPGLLVMRTLALLANEAFEAEATQVASAADIDVAIRLGLNFPAGPIGWAHEVGLEHIAVVIEQLGRLHEADRYRLSYGLRRHLWRLRAKSSLPPADR